MRKIRIILIVAVCLTATVVIAGIVGRCETHYTREATIVEFENGIAVAEDYFGNLWEFESDELVVGESVSLEMYTRGTESIYDDSVERVKGN